MKKESLVVQFVDISPLTNESQFRLCAVNDEVISKPFKTVLAAVTHAESKSSDFEIIKNLGFRPWGSASNRDVRTLSKDCKLFKVVVWDRENGSFSVEDLGGFASAKPVKADLQPERPFWVIDVAKDVVVGRMGGIDLAREEFRGIVKSFEGQF